MQAIEVGNKKYVITGESDRERNKVVDFGPAVEATNGELAASKIAL